MYVLGSGHCQAISITNPACSNHCRVPHPAHVRRCTNCSIRGRYLPDEGIHSPLDQPPAAKTDQEVVLCVQHSLVLQPPANVLACLPILRLEPCAYVAHVAPLAAFLSLSASSFQLRPSAVAAWVSPYLFAAAYGWAFPSVQPYGWSVGKPMTLS